MQGRSLRIIAIVLFGLALALGLYGLNLGTPEPAVEAAAPVPEPRESVWTFRVALPGGAALQPEHLEQVQVLQRNEADVEDAVPYYGRVLARGVSAGSRLQETLLEPDRPMLDALAPGFRAVAVRVDEVTAVGGHLRTGDRVDVLFYLKANREAGNFSSARRLLGNLEVLAYGPELIGSSEQERQERARSVVLAVPASRTAELLLAESSGSLRLAVVGQREPSVPEQEAAVAAHATALRTLIVGPEKPPPPPRRLALPARPKVELYLGEEKKLVSTGY
ncbi:Flp pilus assembly protein CpaB [Marinobacterium aestuariivivens]|uniref:Flp pilus assembly protein CpaB n=1 Tax=Marinobacterium aestuariivivens TaxID=1698799 RepID=A0ABW2A1B7_9GAMM